MLTIDELLQQGRYRITKLFGSEGTGDAYEAYDNTLDISVVLREIPVKLNKVTTPIQLETLKLAFAGEAKALTSIDHNSIIHVRDYFSEIDRHYLVMESVDGNYLGATMEVNNTPFALPDVMNWADQLLDALNYLHTQAPPVIHHDIKPQNIKLDSDGRVKLLALSAASDANAKLGAATTQNFDAAALHYLSLEQIWGKLDRASQKVIANSFDEASEELLNQPADARSDIYALGATLYHMLTAQRPIDALERSIDLIEGKPDPLPSPTRLNASVPPEVSYVVMKALEIKREKRFDSVLMMRQVLKTSLVRVKEREAKEGKKILNVPPAPVSQAPSFAQAKAESGPSASQQLEAIKARLREAEAERVKAEERAAAAERRLREKEKHDVFAYASAGQSDEDQVLDLPSMAIHTTPVAPVAASAPKKQNVVAFDPDIEVSEKKPRIDAQNADDFAFSYAGAEKEKRGMWPVFAAAAAILILGGGGIGAWSVMSNGAKAQTTQIAAPSMSLTEPSKTESPVQSVPAAENIPADTETKTDNASPATESPAPVPAAGDSSGAQRPRQQVASTVAPKPVKTVIPPPQPAKAAPQKKTVTVDDLLN